MDYSVLTHGSIQERLRQSLREAMRARDQAAVSALRSALSAIANAEAVDPAPNKVRLGVGAGDVPRRALSEDEVLAIIRSEIDERHQAGAEYDRLGQPEVTQRLSAEAAVLGRLLTPD